jgi:hypothetical protein
MPLKTPAWEESPSAPDIKMLRLYQTDLNPDWPRILILKLTADRFKEFEHDPLAFDKNYTLFHPESPISWMSTCAKPPHVKGIPPTADSVSWTVVMVKGQATLTACAAFPHESS